MAAMACKNAPDQHCRYHRITCRIDYRESVTTTVGDIDLGTRWVYPDADWCTSYSHSGQHRIVRRVDDRDTVAIRIGEIDPRPQRVYRHAVRGASNCRRDGGHHRISGCVND